METRRLSALVYFRCAGFYPEYWEFTKAIWSDCGMGTPWVSVVLETLGDGYSKDLAAEEVLWEHVSPY